MIRIDARGLRCPWPAVRLARALREGAGVVEIVADDPNASAEIAAVVAAAGASLTVPDHGNGPVFLVVARAVNALFTQSD